MRLLIPLSLAALAAIAFASVPASATGAITCKSSPVSGWKSEKALSEKLTKEG